MAHVITNLGKAPLEPHGYRDPTELRWASSGTCKDEGSRYCRESGQRHTYLDPPSTPYYTLGTHYSRRSTLISW